MDNSGNTATTSFSGINIDKTAPTISASRSPAANGASWNNTDVLASYAASDALSGLGSPTSGSFNFTSEGANQSHMFTVTDATGNTASATVGSVNIDKTSPSATCQSPDGIWHANNVSLACTAGDSLSGLSSPADASFSLVTNIPAGTETANALTDSPDVCDKAGNCTTAGPISGNRIDRAAPVLTVNSPVDGSTYLKNQTVIADSVCTDGGSGIADCTATVANGIAIDTATSGTKTFVVNSTDNVGNSALRTVNYTVVNNPPPGSASADLSITMSSDAPNQGISSGGNIAYTIVVANAGPDTANNVVITDYMPAGTSFVSASLSQGSLTTPSPGANSGGIVGRLNSLASGGTVTLTVVLKITASGGSFVDNIATVQSATLDPKNTNDSDHVKTRVR